MAGRQLGISPCKEDELFHGACPVETAVDRGELQVDGCPWTWGPASSVSSTRWQSVRKMFRGAPGPCG